MFSEELEVADILSSQHPCEEGFAKRQWASYCIGALKLHPLYHMGIKSGQSTGPNLCLTSCLNDLPVLFLPLHLCFISGNSRIAAVTSGRSDQWKQNVLPQFSEQQIVGPMTATRYTAEMFYLPFCCCHDWTQWGSIIRQCVSPSLLLQVFQASYGFQASGTFSGCKLAQMLWNYSSGS